jgi:hypothetical protein
MLCASSPTAVVNAPASLTLLVNPAGWRCVFDARITNADPHCGRTEDRRRDARIMTDPELPDGMPIASVVNLTKVQQAVGELGETPVPESCEFKL